MKEVTTTEQRAKEVAQWVINNRYPKGENNKTSDHEMYHTVHDAILAASPDAGDWKSVEDELPDTRTVIILTEDGVVTVGWYAGSVGDNSWKGDFIGKVTHWRPLPSPPKNDKLK